MARGWRQFFYVPSIAVLIMSCMASVCQAEVKTQQIKAAYLYQISKFVFWPEARKQVASFKVCQLGADRYGGTLQKMVGRTVFNKPVTIQTINSLQQAKQCHLLIISDPAAINSKSLHKLVSEHSVLTVVDGRKHWDKGMVSFVLENKRVRLHINLSLAKLSGLTFAANLLEVASVIHKDK
jgi:hypothetical protein